MKAHDVMTWGIISVEASASVVRAAQIMLENKISGLPVVDASGNLVGIVTEGDFLRRGENRHPAPAAALVGISRRPGSTRNRIRSRLRPQGRRNHDAELRIPSPRIRRSTRSSTNGKT